MLISARRYARLQGVHYNTVYRWIRHGLIPYQVKECPERRRFFIRSSQPPPDLRTGPVPDPFTGWVRTLCALVLAYHRFVLWQAQQDDSEIDPEIDLQD